jgi:hypothetical protein
MSNTHYAGRTATQQPLRVRDQAREALAVLLFSAVTATCLAVALLALATLGGQA